MSNNLIVIPVRLNSSRLPRKALADLNGKPVIRHAYESAVTADVGRVIIACGDQELVDLAHSFGAEAILTDPDLPSGTDRVYAAYNQLEGKDIYDNIINVQGDTPFFPQNYLNKIVELLEEPNAQMASLVYKIKDISSLNEDSYVKVALNPHRDNIERAKAIYFSRSVVPNGASCYYQHIGMYGYKPSILEKIVQTPPADIEIYERLEQLRAISVSVNIEVAVVEKVVGEINTAADLEKMRYALNA